MIDYFKIASDICRKDAERLRRGEPVRPVAYVPLARAALCTNCDSVFLHASPTCPACASEQVMPMATWLPSVSAQEVRR